MAAAAKPRRKSTLQIAVIEFSRVSLHDPAIGVIAIGLITGRKISLNGYKRSGRHVSCDTPAHAQSLENPRRHLPQSSRLIRLSTTPPAPSIFIHLPHPVTPLHIPPTPTHQNTYLQFPPPPRRANSAPPSTPCSPRPPPSRWPPASTPSPPTPPSFPSSGTSAPSISTTNAAAAPPKKSNKNSAPSERAHRRRRGRTRLRRQTPTTVQSKRNTLETRRSWVRLFLS